MTLTPQQQEALGAIIHFAGSGKSLFILKGYAGTGKTTMIKHIVPELQKLGKRVRLMAPTGRAAKVLRDKTGYDTTTVHRGIYSFDKMLVVRHDDEGNVIEADNSQPSEAAADKGTDNLKYCFGIRQHSDDYSPANTVYIIDESSMISSRAATGEMLQFGTGVLLDDLLTYVQPRHGAKVIFVGDPAQLPPVGDNRSAALDESYFEAKGLGVSVAELTEVLRQRGESAILSNAMHVRDLLCSKERNSLRFELSSGEVESIAAAEIADSFVARVPAPSIGDAVVIAYTNASVKDYNDAIRRRYFPGSDRVVAGDVLQVVRNNISDSLNIELFNGDFVRVLEVSPKVETLTAPVWTEVAGERKQVNFSLDFRDAVLQREDGRQVKCKILDTLLNSRERGLSQEQNYALYISLRMRNPKLKKSDVAFREVMMNDPYFNAVQVKYGYAITGHKSQGGEWKTVFADYSGRTGLSDDSLRWTYTATTRAARTLYGVNMPNVTPMSKLQISGIAECKKMAKEACSFAEPQADVALLTASATASQKQKCLCVVERLKAVGSSVQSVKLCSYNDQYRVLTPSGTVVVNCFYNSAGFYTSYTAPGNDVLLETFRNADDMQFHVNYEPSTDALRLLRDKMMSACDDAGVTVTNVVEHASNYYVMYYLLTAADKFAQVQFYFDKNGSLTNAYPSSSLGSADEKLQQLISQLQ